MSARSPEEVVLAWNDAYSRKDIGMAESFFSKDFVRYGDWSHWQPVGLERWAVGQRRFFSAFPDWTWEIERVTTSGNVVVVEFFERGTFTAPYEVLPGLTLEPTGAEYADHDCVIFRVENEKIADFRAFVTTDLERKCHFQSKVNEFIAAQGTSAEAQWAS
jgi:predicted ester cyclase